MKVIFAGTPNFSVPTLEALLAAHHEIKLVLTQPDRPVGRGQKTQFSPIKETALKHGLNVLQPHTLKNAEIQAVLKQQQADVMVVVAYGLLLPEAVLTIPQHGCINVHASLLPRWRGAAPIPYAILAGDEKTGVTIMQMDKGLDTGAMLLAQSITIHADDTTQTLHDRLAPLGAELLINVLSTLEKTGQLTGQTQNDTQATYAGKITKEQAQLDWTQSAAALERQVRAFSPWPVAHFQLPDQTMIRVWQAHAIEQQAHAAPGTILEVTANHLHIACQTGVFSPSLLQFPGRNPVNWSSVFNSKRHLFVEGTQL